jgi:hypothetical protein
MREDKTNKMVIVLNVDAMAVGICIRGKFGFFLFSQIIKLSTGCSGKIASDAELSLENNGVGIHF